MNGSRAMRLREPCQVLTEAAVSKKLRVPQVRLFRVFILISSLRLATPGSVYGHHEQYAGLCGRLCEAIFSERRT